MSKIALATAVVALTAAVPLTMGRAASYLAPGAAPPWGATTTTTTTTETKPVPTPDDKSTGLTGWHSAAGPTPTNVPRPSRWSSGLVFRP